MAFKSECINIRNPVFGQQMWIICGALMCVYSVTLSLISGIISVLTRCFYRTFMMIISSYGSDTAEQCDLLLRCSESVLEVPQCCLVFQANSHTLYPGPVSSELCNSHFLWLRDTHLFNICLF